MIFLYWLETTNNIKVGLFKVNSKSLPESSPSNFSSLSLESSESESKFRAIEMSSEDSFLFGYLFQGISSLYIKLEF